MSGARWSWPGLVVGLMAALVFGLVFGLGAETVAGRVFGLAASLVAGLAGWMIYELAHADGEAEARTVNPVEELSWSGLSGGLRAVLSGGLGIGALTALLRWLQSRLDILWDVVLEYVLKGGLVAAVVVVLVVMLAGGLGSGLSKMRMAPNEGVRRSARRSLALGLIGGLAVAVVAGLVVAVLVILRNGLVGGPVAALVNGLAFGSVFGLVFGLAVGLEFGGIACLRHLTLRRLLVHNGAPPWRFLEDANERLFLSRSGGSYVFRHPLLLEHFADLEGCGEANEAGPTAFDAAHGNL